MKYLILFISICTTILFISCNNTHNTKNDIIAEIDGQPIYANEISSMIKQELYDELYRVYEIKKEALNQLLNIKILEQEAKKKKMTYLEYSDYYTDSIISQVGTDSLFKRYNLTTITELQKNNIYKISSESVNGKTIGLYQLKGAIIKELLDSLRESKKIVKFVYPPKTPSIDLKNLHTYYRGNLQSKVTVITISDFDCESCIKEYNTYNSIYQKYKDKVKFGYIHYSVAPTYAQVAADAANKQNKFWEFHDSIYLHKGYIDSTVVFNIANSLSLNLNKFKKDIDSNTGKTAIEHTINQLVTLGVYATPTILINNRLIINSGSKEEICHLIDEELSI